MIQDIAPHELRNQYEPAAVPEDADRVLIFDGGALAMAQGREKVFPAVSDLPAAARDSLIWLFSLDGERYFLCREKIALADYPMSDLRRVRESGGLPQHLAYAAMTGKHLADWYRDTAFCGRCGQRMSHSLKERAMCCPSCGYTAYPRIMPAVIVGVINGERILLTRYRRGYGHNALIAGFTEIGETMEETVAREVMEEAGLRVKNIRYYKSQPWGIANDILAGYYCDVDGPDEIRMDSDELKEAVWTAREDIVLQPDHYSLTNEMMERFKQHMKC